MRERRWPIGLLSTAICLGLPGCSGCVQQPQRQSESPPQPEDRQQPESTPAEKPTASPPATDPPGKNTTEAEPAAEQPANEPTADAEPPPKKSNDSLSRAQSSSGGAILPETQIRDWLKQARREQAAGRPGKAYVLAADASGLVRRVKDAGQRAALQAEVDALLAAVEPAVERSTRGANTRTDDKPLIEK